MNKTATGIFELTNELGLHARPASIFVQTSKTFKSEIVVENISNGKVADGKSIISMLTLVAPKGTRLQITANGEDADSLLAELAAIFGKGFDED